MTTFTQTFYSQPTRTVAQELLGHFLVLETDNSRKVGRIIETEAYPGIGDKASHSHRGPTPRTEVLFGPAGTIYVYLIYGIYHCLNIVTDTPESGGAVLIRAVEPIEGLEGKTSGPGLLCKAYGIDRSYNGQSIITGLLRIEPNPQAQSKRYLAQKRIGIDYAGSDKDRFYRFRIDD